MTNDRERPSWSVDDFYEEGIKLSPNPTDLLYQEQETAWETISFDPVETDEETLAALADAATQMHYIYLSQLLIMGDLLWNAPDMDTKRMATVLSASRMRDVDAWGRYIAHLRLVRPEISPPLRRFFQELYEEENRFARLMGLIFVDLLRKSLANELQDVEDPTFRKLMQRDAEEGAKNVKMTKKRLKEMSADIDDETLAVAEKSIDEYLAVIEEIVDDRSVTFDALDVDTDTILEECSETIASYRAVIRDD